MQSQLIDWIRDYIDMIRELEQSMTSGGEDFEHTQRVCEAV